ncbi:hypothetical protein G647_05724 [Cladophialophora carrionii CBS 160.54]|uniref:Uncharacterized protein n=1 Tax=Cladophialophora carrionii CBS 160.54 TaxID=1279043 RepID=V9DD98_9EURO|nr:uncharacterized protein G647_05724 [Cladophialophora carrionii CBS 160.54]ETI23917.1 hypothetical protein G647_05724 [Cladophialophora carrionii CBS 160.54]
MPYGGPAKSPELERAQTRLQQSELSFSRTQQELHQAMRVRATTPMSANEYSAKDQEIAQLKRKLRETEEEMKKLHETIEKQKMTIKTQSEAIANPKQHFPTPTSHRYGGNQYGQASLALPPPPQPIFADTAPMTTPSSQSGPMRPSGPLPHQRQTPSPFSAPRSQQPIRQPQGPQVHHTVTPFRQTRSVNDYGSPEAMMHSFANLGLSNTPVGSANRGNETPSSSTRHHTRGIPSNVTQPSPAPTFNPANGMALVQAPDMGAAVAAFAPSEIARKFGEVLHMTETYAYSHVNAPSTQKDNAMPQEVKQRLLNAASTTSAFQFMQTPFTRYMLVNKVILQFVIRTILKHDTFAGFDPRVDQAVENCKNQMYQTTPAQVKYQLLATMAEQVRSIKANPNFPAFVQSIARSRGNELWGILKPMMHQKTSRDWEDLYELMLKAHELAEMMYSGAEEYKFDFPAMGQRFQKDTMEPRDPYRNILTPDQLEQLGATVRLGMTPLITSRTSTAAGYVNSAQVMKAFVLLKTDR